MIKYKVVAIYLRKSREDREVEKYEGVDTLDRHRKTLVGFASSHNLEIGHIYEEVVSGEGSDAMER
jgi:DNA invertase Pin-like site-specific DNA recombinase